MALNPMLAAAYAYKAGFRGSNLAVAVATAMGESSLNPGAVGDTGLANAKWGPSLGLWQVRSLNAEKGKGTWRDASRLHDPAFNARAAFSISNSGSNFNPWTIYKTGAYRRHMNAAQQAAMMIEQRATSRPAGRAAGTAAAQRFQGAASAGAVSGALMAGIRYDSATSDSRGPTPGGLAMAKHWTASTGLGNMGIYNYRNIRGGKSLSVHSEGRAVDLAANSGNPDEKAKAVSYIRWMIRNAQALQVQYIIYDRWSWHPARGWKPYKGVNPHTDHIHAELNRNGAYNVSPLWRNTLRGGGSMAGRAA